MLCGICGFSFFAGRGNREPGSQKSREQPGRGRETQAKRLHSGGDKVSRCLAVQLSLARRFYSSVSVKNKKMWPPFSYRYSNKSTNTLHEEFRGLHIESVFWSLSIKMSCSELKEKVLSELNCIGEIYFYASHETWLQHVWNPPPERKRRLTENTPPLMPSLWRPMKPVCSFLCPADEVNGLPERKAFSIKSKMSSLTNRHGPLAGKRRGITISTRSDRGAAKRVQRGFSAPVIRGPERAVEKQVGEAGAS